MTSGGGSPVDRVHVPGESVVGDGPVDVVHEVGQVGEPGRDVRSWQHHPQPGHV